MAEGPRRRRRAIWLAAVLAGGAAVFVGWPLLVLFTPLRWHIGQPRDGIHCSTNLRELGLALLMYADDSGGYLPPAPARGDEDAWLDAVRQYSDWEVYEQRLHCLLDKQRRGRTSYRFLPSAWGLKVEGLSEEEASKKPILAEKWPWHGNGTERAVWYAYGSVRFVRILPQ